MKGLSPLIAAVFLLAMAVTVTTIIGPWAYSLVRTDTAHAENRSGTITKCAPISIEDIYLDFEKNISRVFVLALGDTRVTSMEILNRNGENATLMNSTTLPFSMGSGERRLVEFNITNVINSCSNFSKATVSNDCISDEKLSVTNC